MALNTRIYIYKVFVAFLLLLTATAKGYAQDEVEYRMEIGAGPVLNAYMGDFNDSPFSNMNAGGALAFRSIFNPYSALRVSAMYAGVHGAASNVKTVYPDLEKMDYRFNNSVIDLSVTYEYNFFPYGTGREYRGAKRLTPFISIGLGMTTTICNGGKWDFSSEEPYQNSKSDVTLNFPVGIGVKYKLKPRLNLSLDWQWHFTLSDFIDGVKDPYRISSSGIFKNTDCYSTLTLALTYSFLPKCVTCHKDR